MKKIVCIIFCIFFFLTACVGDVPVSSVASSKEPLSPQPPEDPSIIGVYVFTYMQYREGFPSKYADIEDEELRYYQEQKSLIDTPRLYQLNGKAFRFNADGTFDFYYPHNKQIIESGVYTYNGNDLKLYYTSGDKYDYKYYYTYPGLLKVLFRRNKWILYMDFEDSLSGETAMFLYDQSYSETSSSETQ